ncbi:hypothetical protein ACFE04_003371 [Oxalis oulophora]
MGKKRDVVPLPPAINKLYLWLLGRSLKVKAVIGACLTLCLLVALKLFVHDDEYDTLFIASGVAHSLGLFALIYKLIRQKTCAGLSLKSQELTALFLAVRIYGSYTIEANIHAILDSTTLICTIWVIYMIRFKLNSTYSKELDTMPHYFLVVPCVILAFIGHPWSRFWFVSRVMWAFSNYLEAISVLPQLRLMQNAKMIELFTGRYVFALGVAKFLNCAQWIIQIYETKGTILFSVGGGYFWVPMMMVAEIVHAFILVDFCYYYVKSWREGELVMKMPV